MVSRLVARTRRGSKAGADALVDLCLEREALLAVEDLFPDVVALLAQLLAAGLSGRGDDYNFVCRRGRHVRKLVQLGRTRCRGRRGALVR